MSARDRERRGAVSVALVLSTLLAAPGTCAGDDAGQRARFRVDAALVAQQASSDGRYAVHGALSTTPSQTSGDGRYAVYAVKGVGCAALPELIFADGFE
jgi:hypothetical protein